MYDDVAINCFRFFGFTSFDQVDALTIKQYNLMVKALDLRQVDEEYRIHRQAFENYRVRATRGRKNKPVYSNFKKFFDYRKALDEVRKPGKDGKPKYSSLIEYKRSRKEGKDYGSIL